MFFVCYVVVCLHAIGDLAGAAGDIDTAVACSLQTFVFYIFVSFLFCI